MTVINVGIGLIVLIVINIVLGSLDAWLATPTTFDKDKCKKGIIKGAVVALCFIATYGVGYLNPDIMAVNINGIDVNLLIGVTIILSMGYVWYAKEVISKLSKFINAKVTIEEKIK
jgi:uncharacterized membrane protein (DUF485 family)